MSENILDSVENDDESETIEGEMDFMEKNALQKCRTQIVKDLDIRLIVDDLIAFKVISESDYELIKNQVSILKQLTKFLGEIIFFFLRLQVKLKLTPFWTYYQPEVPKLSNYLLMLLEKIMTGL